MRGRGETQRHQRPQIGREMCETEKCGGSRLVSRRSLYSTKLCALCVSVFQIPTGDAQTGETQRHREHRSEGNSVKQNSAAGADWCRVAVSTQPNFVLSVSLCVKFRPGMRGRGETQRHRGHRSGREMCETEKCGGRRLVSRRSLYSTKLCALCVSVFQIPAGDARTRGNTEAQRSQIGKGMGWEGTV